MPDKTIVVTLISCVDHSKGSKERRAVRQRAFLSGMVPVPDEEQPVI
jgi:hypothetical protein